MILCMYRMKRMEKKLKKQLKSQEVADDEFGFYGKIKINNNNNNYFFLHMYSS